MNIAIHNPMFSGAAGLNGWIVEFIKLYKPAFYISDIRYIPRLLYFMQRHALPSLQHTFLFSTKDVRAYADVLLGFNGHPYRQESRPVKEFLGLKIYHLMDYTFFPSQSNKALIDAGVDFVFGYARHDLYCPFFQKAYPSYQGKVIPVPFGFAERFKAKTPLEERKNKVIALGAVNSFSDPVHDIDDFKELNTFFLERGERFMHKFRRMLVENEQGLSDIMDSKLPHFPQVKDFGYDIVQVLNQYKMFVSCESLLYFPAAKTFEGPASGTALICSDHPCFGDLGFQDGINCITHRQFDLGNFREKASFYISHPEQLLQIQYAGTSYVRENFNHKKIAEYVYGEIEKRYQTGPSYSI